MPRRGDVEMNPGMMYVYKVKMTSGGLYYGCFEMFPLYFYIKNNITAIWTFKVRNILMYTDKNIYCNLCNLDYITRLHKT